MGYKVKKIYVGTQQVRPSGISKSIDVRGKTLAQIQAEGWDIYAYSGGYVLDNNGLKNDTTTGNNVVYLYYHLSQSLTSSNKIKIHLTGYRTRYYYTYAGWQDIGLINTIASSGINSVGGCYNVSQYGDNSTGINYYYNNVLTTLSSVGPNSPGGDTDLTWELDLSNGNITYNITSPTTRTGTCKLSSSQLSYVLGLNYVFARTIQTDSNHGDYGLIKTVDFTIS